jgi:hypothetical protein
VKIDVLNILLHHLLSLTKQTLNSIMFKYGYPPSHFQNCLKHRELLNLIVDDITNKFVKPDERSGPSNPSTAMYKQWAQVVLKWGNGVGKIKQNLKENDKMKNLFTFIMTFVSLGAAMSLQAVQCS